ncbi:hypothetical protein LAZ67_6002107 [Cordylochernes scorpioides]|uniref:Reverse transcriptase domain-containing protein n=1 Tax=Cordylochernes scorpioides TaxID=51811 RepID=A0ABY6KMQ6_9ARAC|nr:hypothetical protein LAZ67_6002107 [Cordylochernes scorpioides]
MSFGLCNAAQTFQRLINEEFQGLDFAYAYIDDVLIASDSENQHVSHLQQLFGRLQDYGLTINETKCTFGQPSVKFLGFIITNAGISPDPQRRARTGTKIHYTQGAVDGIGNRERQPDYACARDVIRDSGHSRVPSIERSSKDHRRIQLHAQGKAPHLLIAGGVPSKFGYRTAYENLEMIP